VLFVSHP